MGAGKRGGRDWAAFLAFALRVEPQVRLAASRINRGRVTPERCKIREASLITGLDIRTLQEKAARGDIPGAEKPFGRWTFDIAKLRQLKGRQCAVSTRGMGYTGRVSRSGASNIATAYEHVLRQSRSAG